MAELLLKVEASALELGHPVLDSLSILLNLIDACQSDVLLKALLHVNEYKFEMMLLSQK